MPQTETAKATELINECKKTKSVFLDLGNLALNELPGGLSAARPHRRRSCCT